MMVRGVMVRTPKARLIALYLVLFAGLSVLVAGCGSDEAAGPTTTAADTSATETLSLLSETENELVKTYEAQQLFAEFLDEQKAADDDPRMGIFYGLQARTQALSCRDALEGGFLEAADSAVLDMDKALGKAQTVATGSVARALADARAIVQTMGVPSEAPAAAAMLIDRFVAELAPLLDEAIGLLSAPTTIASGRAPRMAVGYNRALLEAGYAARSGVRVG